jgi:tetratricopeptide (TPR) repeat protein
MDATVAYSINGGYLDSSRRWVGDLIVDSLRIPGLVSLPAMTRRYEFLQGTDLLMRMGRYDELLKDLVNIPPEEEREPVLLLYAAKAYQQSGNLSQAFRYAETACLRDRRYCSAFAEIGASLLEKRGLAAAEPFFRRGYELNPRMDNGQFRYAMALSRVGRYDDAIRYFHIFRNGYGVFPVDFYLAKASQMKGDDATAKLYYDSALAELMKNQELMGGFGDVSVLEKGALFYDSHGESGSAKLLRQLAKKREIELDAPMEPLLY